MTKVVCQRRGCPSPATVATKTPSGAVDEHLCEVHAWEIVKTKVAALERFSYLGTRRPFVTVTFAKVETT